MPKRLACAAHNIDLLTKISLSLGHGWSGANCLVWNSRLGNGIVVQKPPTAHNFAGGFYAKKGKERKTDNILIPFHSYPFLSPTVGSTNKRAKVRIPSHEWGWWESPSKPVWPDSLYLTQLEERRVRDRV